MRSSIGDRIVTARKNAGYSQTELATAIGISKQLLYKYEVGKITNIPSDRIEKIAEITHVSPAYIMGWIDTPTLTEKDAPIASNLISVRPREIPILGTICAGNGIYAEENYQGSFSLDKGISADYAIHVKGGSMTGAGIQDGDLAFIRKCDGDIVNGRIYAVILNGSNEATLKAVTAHEDFVVLTPLNPAYPVITTYSQEVHIAGELVGVYHPCL